MQLKIIFLILVIIPNLLVNAQMYIETEKTTMSSYIDTLDLINEFNPTVADFIYSYYEQDGIHSPVTGGIGDEQLYDYARTIKLYIPLRDDIDLSLITGIETYTSASTDNINNEHDLLIETSASYRDERKYTDISLQLAKSKSLSFGINSGVSREWDVNSVNGGISLAYSSLNENSQVKLSGVYYKDEWEMIYPFELRSQLTNGETEYQVRNSYNFSLTLSQVINKRFKMALSLETVYQKGILSTPFHRVYFADTTHSIEQLPNNRLKIPLGLHSSYYVNDWVICRFFYRFYQDDFGINGHTIQLETPLKASSFFIISPFYRIHTQTASKYFEPFAMHSFASNYYTSDYDLSAITSHKFGIGLKYAPLFGFFNKINNKKNTSKITFKKAEIRTSKYLRMNDNGIILKAYIATVGVTYNIN